MEKIPSPKSVNYDDFTSNKKRTFSDKLITNLNSLKYKIFEPIVLNFNRIIYKKNYNKNIKNPLVSICIPTYNRGSILIKRAIKSALSQTYKNIEVIVVGHCCTDNTAELLSKIKDKRLKFYNMQSRTINYPKTIENLWFVGPAEPANMAMKLATGTWLARLDDDDTWTEDHIEKLLDFAIAGNYEFVSALYVEKRFGQSKVNDAKMALDEYYTRKKSIKSVRLGGVQTWLFRSYIKAFKYNLNCWRKDWNKVNDIDLSQRIFKAGVRIGFLNEIIAYVFPRPGEKTIGLDAYKLLSSNSFKKTKKKF